MRAQHAAESAGDYRVVRVSSVAVKYSGDGDRRSVHFIAVLSDYAVQSAGL